MIRRFDDLHTDAFWVQDARVMNNPPDNLRRISSSWTLYHKVALPVIAVVMLTGFARAMWGTALSDGASFFLAFATIFVGIIGYHLWNAFRIKRVRADSRNLYVSNYFKETTIPLSEIADVTEIVWIEPRIVTIHLKSPSEFGQKVAFLAPWRMFNWYRPSPIVADLRQMAGQTVYKEVSGSWFS